MILGFLLSLTLGNPSYPIRHGSEVALRVHPYLAAVVSVAAYYHPDAEVRTVGRRLWSPRLSDLFYLTKRTEEDTITEEHRAAAERVNLVGEWDDSWYYPPRDLALYRDRISLRPAALTLATRTVFK